MRALWNFGAFVTFFDKDESGTLDVHPFICTVCFVHNAHEVFMDHGENIIMTPSVTVLI